MPGFNQDFDPDPQDQAEGRDETFLADGETPLDMRTFEELPDLLDWTWRVGDRDDEEARALDAKDFDADEFADEDFEEDDELHYRAAVREADDFYDDGKPTDDYDEDELDDSDIIEGLREEVADADLVTGGEDDFTDFQSKGVADEDLERMGYLNAGARKAD